MLRERARPVLNRASLRPEVIKDFLSLVSLIQYAAVILLKKKKMNISMELEKMMAVSSDNTREKEIATSKPRKRQTVMAPAARGRAMETEREGRLMVKSWFTLFAMGAASRAVTRKNIRMEDRKMIFLL